MQIKFQNVCPQIFKDIQMTSDIWNTDFILKDRERIQVLAHSGKGKTSLLYFLLGLRDDFSGMIFLDGNNSRDLGQKEWGAYRKNKIACVFQDLQLIEKLTVEQNIQLLPEFAQNYSKEKAYEMLIELGLEDKWDSRVATLSFGQKQRVALIRTLCKPFELLICDEPFSHIDEKNKMKCVALIERRLVEEQAGLLLTSLDGEPTLELKIIKL